MSPAHRRTPPVVLMWVRTDVPGSEVVTLDTSTGLYARGSQHAVDPLPYRLSYELWADATWAAMRLVAHAEGAGWTRDLELSRTGSRWTALGETDGAPALASFDGSGLRTPAPPGISDRELLSSAVDLDIGGSPLTNALPVNRLGLLNAPRGSHASLVSAWVLPPTLEVVASAQTYTALGEGIVRFGDGATGADIRYDSHGWVVDYPGLARRVTVATER